MTTAETAWAEAMKFDNRADPYPFFDELRKTPVAQVADGIYVVTGYRELMALAHDPRISSDISRSPLRQSPRPRPSAAAGAEHMQAYGRRSDIIMSDPPDHDRARRQVMRHFGPPHSPDLIPKMEPDIQRLCNELLDKVKAKGKTRHRRRRRVRLSGAGGGDLQDPGRAAEGRTHVSRLDLRHHGRAWTWARKRPPKKGRPARRRARESTAALAQYMAELIEGYLREPGDGPALEDGERRRPGRARCRPQEAAANAMLLLIAGHDSTVNTISHCVLTLLRNPGSLELLRSRPELIPRAIEEVLRLQSAVQFFPSRSATADIEIGGTVIPKGSPVHLMYGAANRDPSRFPNPNQFDPERPDNEHFGWGSGIHTCFGGPLARLEVNIALETFLRRVENPRLVVDPPPYRQSQVFRGPRHLAGRLRPDQ